MSRRLAWIVMTALTVVLAPLAMRAQEEPTAKAQDKEKEKAKEEKEKEKTKDDEVKPPVITQHELRIGDRTLKYTATAGLMPLRDNDDKLEARIFYVAYTAEPSGDTSRRPLMFSFNGGPGSSSVWLHLGALGPRRVAMPEDPTIPRPPFRLVDNAETWLEKTDLVFIDPVGTGYSRAVRPELNKKFHGLKGDIESVGEFIRLYLTRSERWTSPLFLVGESYGTTRAAGLSGELADLGIVFNGVILISTVLDFQTLQFGHTNDLPYFLYLPSYTATAWYHKRLPAELQQMELRQVLDRAERWADGPYRAALARGDELPEADRRALLVEMARYTGLSERFLDLNNLRVSQSQFGRELLRDQRRTIGRFDSRYLGLVENAGGTGTEFDPSLAAVRPAFTATFNHYVRHTLGYKSDTPYHILGGLVGPWDWGPTGQGYPETESGLRSALLKNPHMKVLVASGIYDLATPYAATDYTLAHMKLDPALRRNVREATYEAGHMMYLHPASLAKLKRDAARFLDESAAP